MAAPLNNKFWELRSKHGREKLFTTPELMWEAACEFFQSCIDNPWIKVEQTKVPPKAIKDEDGEIIGFTPNTVNIPTTTPFTFQGLCSYLHCNSDYFRQFKKNLKEENVEEGKGFSWIIARIEDTIYRQKFEGAVVGAYSAAIIARDLGLSEKQQTEITGKDGGNISVTLNLQ